MRMCFLANILRYFVFQLDLSRCRPKEIFRFLRLVALYVNLWYKNFNLLVIHPWLDSKLEFVQPTYADVTAVAANTATAALKDTMVFIIMVLSFEWTGQRM